MFTCLYVTPVVGAKIYKWPVANIGGGFLDFLREYVLVEKRQVFFATANGKMASLFMKKFDFLGDDFKSVQLARDSD